jgi:hypothetical protein
MTVEKVVLLKNLALTYQYTRWRNRYTALLLLSLLFLSVTHGIYSYVPETSPVPTVCSVAAVLCLQSVPHVIFFPLQHFVFLY